MDKDYPRCGNCNHHYPPVCVYWKECDKPMETSPNGWCDKWEKNK